MSKKLSRTPSSEEKMAENYFFQKIILNFNPNIEFRTEIN